MADAKRGCTDGRHRVECRRRSGVGGKMNGAIHTPCPRVARKGVIYAPAAGGDRRGADRTGGDGHGGHFVCVRGWRARCGGQGRRVEAMVVVVLAVAKTRWRPRIDVARVGR